MLAARPPQLQPALETLLPLYKLMNHCACVYQKAQPDKVFLTQKSMLKNGGSDPLDFIHVYMNDMEPDQRHWHYVSFGLSDIYNYSAMCGFARAHNLTVMPMTDPYPPNNPQNPQKLSGFGFELTFRLKCHDSEQEPPTWPIDIMQSLARYVFKSKNTFKVGDHVRWDRWLDDSEESNIRHLLMTSDLQLRETDTNGLVKFIQIVGVCQQELQAATELNVKEVLDIMMQRPETGGRLLVTDMRRGEDIFQLDPENVDRIQEAISRSGSNMTLLCAKHKYSSSRPKWFDEVESFQKMEDHGNLKYRPTPITPPPPYTSSRTTSRMSNESESALLIENAELVDTRYYNSVYLIMTHDSAKILPVALKRRLRHRKCFTFQNSTGDLLTTLVPEGSSTCALVNHEQPLARNGTWLQIFVTDEFREEMLELIGEDFSREIRLPRNYSWPRFRVYLTVVEEL